MEKLVWGSPTIEALKAFRTLPYRGSDTSWVNIFLLRRKYKLEIAVHDGVLYRCYHGKDPNRQGYGFPLSADKLDTKTVYRMIRQDAKERGGVKFCLCDEEQREVLDRLFTIHWQSEEGDNDYLYEGEKWLDFAGRKYQRLRNHVNSFRRLYPDAAYHAIDSERRLKDALKVSDIWQDEHKEKEMPSPDLKEELHCITEAAKYWDELGMTGGVLYVQGAPVAATMASFLSTELVDFHFDKAVGKFAAAGATVVSRRQFAAVVTAQGRKVFNLEEDMNIPGLRQSKEAYRPMMKLAKYYGGEAVC